MKGEIFLKLSYPHLPVPVLYSEAPRQASISGNKYIGELEDEGYIVFDPHKMIS